jgi:hypothetical protein
MQEEYAEGRGMSWRQIELARHALGLPNNNKKSYRNRFVAGRGHRDYADWMGMVDAGLASREDGKTLTFGGNDLFYLTIKGAKAVLNPAERLCPEDFPEANP